MMLTLVIEEDFQFRECRDCGDEIPDPYLEDDNDEQEVLCSSCEAERAYRRRLKRLEYQHAKPSGLGEAVCDCGKRLPDCSIATCHRPDPPPKHRVQKPKERQRKLF